MEKYEIGLAKKSFTLHYHNGDMCCEHLDSLEKQKVLVINKFKEDLIQISKPSTSSFIIVNLDETSVDNEIIDLILDTLNALNKSVNKVVLVGLNRMIKRYIRKKRNLKFIVTCIDDYELAKEWLFMR